LTESSDLWFWLLTLGAAVIGGGWFAFRWLHLARVVEDTPTSRVRSAACSVSASLGPQVLRSGGISARAIQAPLACL